jgi:hypothetical protein
MSTKQDNKVDPSINIIEPVRYQSMLKWYDQQIALSKKAKELAELDAGTAKARAEETFHISQMARLTAPAPTKAPDATSSAPEEKTDPD